MRIATISQRLCLIAGGGAIDVQAASDGRFSADPAAVYPRWAEFRDWAASARLPEPAPFEAGSLGSPSPSPRQVFGIGLNYADHVARVRASTGPTPRLRCSRSSRRASPARRPRSPCRRAATPTGKSSWSSSSAQTARGVPAAAAWEYVAGLSVGQDVSERILQMAAKPPQFSLGKSFPGFGPVGPWLVTPDEFADPDDLELGCAINGEDMQKGRTRDMIFGVRELIEQLSAVTPLLPGDLIFTGTPSGVGMGRSPQRWLAPGDVLTSYIEGIGEMRHTFVAA